MNPGAATQTPLNTGMNPGAATQTPLNTRDEPRCCYTDSTKQPKFELYKHNDELLNIYYGIFYEL